jgi:hypothetical protein
MNNFFFARYPSPVVIIAKKKMKRNETRKEKFWIMVTAQIQETKPKRK